MALLANAALGQSLSIRKGESEFLISAAAPPDTRYVLQASGNLHLWVDISDEVSGQVSNRIDSSGTTNLFFRLTAPIPFPPITIVVLGDSSVADFASNFNLFNGWGQGLHGYFKPNARVINLAYPGYSSKDFLASDEKAKMIAIKPDFVLVAFGLVDEFGVPEEATTLEEFEDNLKTILQIVRGFNGTPILVTPSVERFFNAQGKTFPAYPDRFAVVADVAYELKTDFIDLNHLSVELVNQMGKSGSDYIWSGVEYLHFSDKGAKIIAGLVANALPDRLGPYLIGIFNPRPKP